jgi:hypothetical protein
MKKSILIVLLAAATVTSVWAQDIKKAKNAYNMSLVTPAKIEEAKTEIDKVFQGTVTKADALHLRYQIYTALIKSPVKDKYPEIEFKAMEALKAYLEVDKEEKLIKEDRFGGINDIYSTFFTKGYDNYKAKEWAKAVPYFVGMAELGDIMIQRKWSASKFDTTAYLFAGINAQNAKQDDVAAKYYSALADQKIGGDDYEAIYDFLARYYSKKKDKANFDKYIATAIELYPKNKGLWSNFAMDYINDNFTLAEKVTYFEAEDAKGTLTPEQYVEFGNMFAQVKIDPITKVKIGMTKSEATHDLGEPDEVSKATTTPTTSEVLMYKELGVSIGIAKNGTVEYVNDNNAKDRMDSATAWGYKKKAEVAFIKGYQKDNTSGIAAFNAGVMFFDEFREFGDKIQANREWLQALNSNKKVEKDPKKKAAYDAAFKAQTDGIKKANTDLEAPQLASANNAIEWMEKSYNLFKTKTDKNNVERNCYKESTKLLTNLYEYKREKAKGKVPADYDKYDKLYQQFGNEYDKLSSGK